MQWEMAVGAVYIAADAFRAVDIYMMRCLGNRYERQKTLDERDHAKRDYWTARLHNNDDAIAATPAFGPISLLVKWSYNPKVR